MPERRRSTRFRLNYHTTVSDAVTNQYLGKLLDISTDGAMLVSEFVLPISQTFHLKLKLDQEISDQSYLVLDAMSIWSHPDIEPGTYNTGFELLELTPEERELIFRLANTFGVD